MTQAQTVYRHLKTGKSITALQALKRWGILRLAARIDELRRHHVIETAFKSRNGKRWASYRMVRE